MLFEASTYLGRLQKFQSSLTSAVTAMMELWRSCGITISCRNTSIQSLNEQQMLKLLRPAAALNKLQTPNHTVRASIRAFSTSRAFAMPVYKGGCYCGELKYTVDVSPDDARTSLCHCKNCKVSSLWPTICFSLQWLTTHNRNSSAQLSVSQQKFQCRLSRTLPTRRSPLYMKPTMVAVPCCIESSVRHAAVGFWRLVSRRWRILGISWQEHWTVQAICHPRENSSAAEGKNGCPRYLEYFISRRSKNEGQGADVHYTTMGNDGMRTK